MDIRWGMISIDFMPHFLYKRVFELYKFKQFLGVGRFSALKLCNTFWGIGDAPAVLCAIIPW